MESNVFSSSCSRDSRSSTDLIFVSDARTFDVSSIEARLTSFSRSARVDSRAPTAWRVFSSSFLRPARSLSFSRISSAFASISARADATFRSSSRSWFVPFSIATSRVVTSPSLPFRSFA